MRKQHLYTKPYITAGVFMALGLGLMALGFLFQGDADMNNYALGAFGLLALLLGVIIFIVYGKQEQEFRKLLGEKPLLRAALQAESSRAQAEKNIREKKAKNKALLLVMLFFCALFAVILPFFVAEKLLMAVICLAIGAFLALFAFVITAYRAHKMRKGGDMVILGRNGAFLHGTFHAWNLPGTAITNLFYTPPGAPGQPGELKISYTAPAYPAPMSETLILLIPKELEKDIPGVLAELDGIRG